MTQLSRPKPDFLVTDLNNDFIMQVNFNFKFNIIASLNNFLDPGMSRKPVQKISTGADWLILATFSSTDQPFKHMERGIYHNIAWL